MFYIVPIMVIAGVIFQVPVSTPYLLLVGTAAQIGLCSYYSLRGAIIPQHLFGIVSGLGLILGSSILIKFIMPTGSVGVPAFLVMAIEFLTTWGIGFIAVITLFCYTAFGIREYGPGFKRRRQTHSTNASQL